MLILSEKPLSDKAKQTALDNIKKVETPEVGVTSMNVDAEGQPLHIDMWCRDIVVTKVADLQKRNKT